MAASLSRLLRRSLGWFGGFCLAIYLSTLAVFVALELSIDGGIETVVNGPDANPAAPWVIENTEVYHLDDPVPVRHAKWLVDAVQGDFKRSSSRGQQTVTSLLAPRMPITFQIAVAAFLLSVLIGLPLGVFAVLRADTWLGHVVSSVLGMFQSIPHFMMATLLIWIVAVRLGWLPAVGWVRPSTSISGNLRSLIFPAFALGIPAAGAVGRVVQTSLTTVLGEEYITSARAKGLPARTILFRHAMRPSSPTLLAHLGLEFGALLAGAVIVEQIFAIGGMGVALFDASLTRDLHLLLGVTVYTVTLIFLIRGLLDLVHLWADPRTRKAEVR